MTKEYEPYKHQRWNDTSLPKVIGHTEIPKEQRIEARKRLYERLINSDTSSDKTRVEAQEKLNNLLETNEID